MATKIYEHIFEKYDLKVESRTPGIVKCNNPLKLIKFGLV